MLPRGWVAAQSGVLWIAPTNRSRRDHDALTDPADVPAGRRRRARCRRRARRPGDPRHARPPARVHLHRQGRRPPRGLRGRGGHAQLPRILHRHARADGRLVAAPGGRSRTVRRHGRLGFRAAGPVAALLPPRRQRRRGDRHPAGPQRRFPGRLRRRAARRLRLRAAGRHALPVEGRAARLPDRLGGRRAGRRARRPRRGRRRRAQPALAGRRGRGRRRLRADRALPAAALPRRHGPQGHGVGHALGGRRDPRAHPAAGAVGPRRRP